jgi:hypothetical protein
LDAVAKADESDDANPNPLHVLLESDARVVRNECVEASVYGRAKKNTVSQAKPALRTNGGRFVSRQFGRKVAW